LIINPVTQDIAEGINASALNSEDGLRCLFVPRQQPEVRAVGAAHHIAHRRSTDEQPEHAIVLVQTRMGRALPLRVEVDQGVNRKRWQKSHRTPHICVRKFNLPQYIGVSNSKCGENHVKYTSTALNLFSLIEIAPVDQS
jgi:hypothetical protein